MEVHEEARTDLLDAAAAMAVSQRQPLQSEDPRREIQLLGMRRAEQVLMALAGGDRLSRLTGHLRRPREQGGWSTAPGE